MGDEQTARIHRAPHGIGNAYFLMRRHTAQDERLSWEALGLLTYLLSKPDDWVIKAGDLQKRCGRDKVYRLLSELIDAGYVVRTEVLNELSQYTGIDYEVHESPLPENPDTGNPLTEKPDSTYYREEDSTESKENSLSPSANDEFAPLPLSRRAQPPTPTPSPEAEMYAPLEEEGKVKRKWSPLGLYLRDFLAPKYKGKGVPREFDKLDNRVVVGLGTADSPNNLFVSEPTYRVWVERQMAYWVERKEIEISPRHIVSAIASPTAFSDARWGYLPYRYNVEQKADKDARNAAEVTKAAQEGVVEPWEQEIFNMLKGKTDADASREA